MKSYTIENERFLVCISSMGAELARIYDKQTRRELLWQGDEAIWTGRAPWLFPVIGQLKDGGFAVNGQKYAMPMHGFAKRTEFARKAIAPDEATFALSDSEDTRAVYPWRFSLTIRYALEADGLRIECAVQNHSEDEMYFSFGAHPGLLCAPGDRLMFEQPEAPCCLRLDDKTHLLRPETTPWPGKPGEIMLAESLFDEDAMIFRAPQSTHITLCRADGGRVRFSFGRVPYLGVWSKKRKGLPYVCLEPWFGVDDPIDADGDIAHKEGIQRLAAGGVFKMPMKIMPL